MAKETGLVKLPLDGDGESAGEPQPHSSRAASITETEPAAGAGRTSRASVYCWCSSIIFGTPPQLLLAMSPPRGTPIIQGDEDSSMSLTRSAKLWNAFVLSCTLALLAPQPSLAQGAGTGTVTGRVTRSDDQSPLPSVSVTVQ